MPRQKDLKRLVRARMKKTGEAYTAARMHIINKSKRNHAARAARTSGPPSTQDYAILAGISDGSILAVGFLPKGKAKSSVAVSQMKLPDKETANRLKQYWSDQLAALADVLAT